ncbi:MAG: hypothetical protein V7782_09010 [Psychromonas sp.]
MKTTLTEQFPASIDEMQSNTSVVSTAMNEGMFFLKSTVIISATILLLASAWV